MMLEGCCRDAAMTAARPRSSSRSCCRCWCCCCSASSATASCSSFRQSLSQAAAEGARAAAVTFVEDQKQDEAVRAVNEALDSFGVSCVRREPDQERGRRRRLHRLAARRVHARGQRGRQVRHRHPGLQLPRPPDRPVLPRRRLRDARDSSPTRRKRGSADALGRDERGAVADRGGGGLMVLVLIAAFVVDLGMQRVARRDMQSLPTSWRWTSCASSTAAPWRPDSADARPCRGEHHPQQAVALGDTPRHLPKVELGKLDAATATSSSPSGSAYRRPSGSPSETSVGFAFVPGSGGAVAHRGCGPRRGRLLQAGLVRRSAGHAATRTAQRPAR